MPTMINPNDNESQQELSRKKKKRRRVEKKISIPWSPSDKK